MHSCPWCDASDEYQAAVDSQTLEAREQTRLLHSAAPVEGGKGKAVVGEELGEDTATAAGAEAMGCGRDPLRSEAPACQGYHVRVVGSVPTTSEAGV